MLKFFKDLHGKRNFFSILIFLICFNVAAVFIARAIEKQFLEQDVQTSLVTAIAVIEDNLRENTLALKRMGDRWTATNGTSELAWRADAKSYARDLLGVVGTGYANANSAITWIEPEVSNRDAVGFRLASEERRNSALIESQALHAATMTRSLELKQGGKGFLVVYPVYTHNKQDGFVYLVGRYADYFPKLLRDNEFNYLVTSGDEVIYESNQSEYENKHLTSYAAISEVPIKYTSDWKIKVTPTLAKYQSYNMKFTYWTLLSTGLLTVIIIVILVLLARSQYLSSIINEQNVWKNTILNSSELVVISTDVHGKVISFNSSAEKLLGYKSVEVVKKETPALWHDPKEILDRATTLKKEFGVEIEPGFEVFVFKARQGLYDKNVWTFHTKTGLRKQVALSVYALKDDNFKIIGYVGIIEEVSDQYKLRDQLAENEKAFTNLLETTFDGYFERDFNRDYQYMSPRFWEMLGYDASEKAHHPSEWQKVISPEGLKLKNDNLEKHIATKGQLPFEQIVRFIHKSGRDVWVLSKGKIVQWNEDNTPAKLVGTHTDVTELVRQRGEIEQAKKDIVDRNAKILELNSRNEDWFRTITSSLPQLMWTCQPDGPCDYLSEQWVNFTGIPENKQLGFEWIQQIHPADQERVKKEWQANVVKESIFSIRFRIRRHDGVYHWFDTKAIPIKDGNGKIIRWLGSNSDIQEIFAAKEKSEHSEKLLQDAQEVSKIGSWELDLKTESLNWSKQMYINFNLSDKEQLPTLSNFRTLYTPENPKEWDEKIEACKSKGLPYSARLIVGKGNEKKWIMARGEAIFENGVVIGLRGTCQDITEEVNTTKVIEDIKARLEIALEGSNIGIWEWDVVNNTLLWDDQMFAIYGQKRDNFTNAYEAWVKGVHPEDIDQTQKEVDFALRNMLPFNTQFRVVHDNGNIAYVLARAKVIRDSQGMPVKMIGINWDITKIKLNEIALENAKIQAMQSSVAKAQFLANMSHEIRTPLNGIVGMTNILKDSELDDQQREHLEHIVQSSSILLALINDILDLSKIESGKIEIENIDFNLEQTIDFVVSTLSFSAKNKGIKLIRNYEYPIPHWLKGDPSRLKQVILNLVNNAIKFTHHGSVSIKTAILNSNEGKIKFRVEVIDTGIGISQEHQQKLFQNFTQADASTHRKFGGTGLGLSISKLLIEKLGGVIGVTSEIGRGSTFWFELELPVGEESLTPDDLLEVMSLNLERSSAKILVAEDNLINQKVASAILAKLGYECQVVANGVEVLRILENFTFDLILMDCQMPEMDGFEATEKIRTSNNENIKDIPIIAMTANAMSGDRERCISIGMNDYLSKPVSGRDLANTLDKWLLRSKKQKA